VGLFARDRSCRSCLLVIVASLVGRGIGAGPSTADCQNADCPAPVVETGQAFEELVSFDELMRAFVRDNEIPGASLAVARQGRVVYARGFGCADVQRKRPVQSDSLFRIASISKPITAVTIMRLVDQGKLKLDDRVFDLLPHGPHLPHGGRMDPRLKKITIRQLLQHTSGWDRDVSIDPMFHSVKIAHSLGVPAPAEPDHIVRFMMGWQLDFDPGARHAYSNFGYCLLGRVIEQVSGRGYEDHVRQDLLEPLGIRSMRIGKTLAEGRVPDEVCYYTQNNRTAVSVVGQRCGAKVPRPYGAWYLEAMDAHGGWIASAVDLVRFASAVENVREPKLLSPESARAMFARPAGAAGHSESGEPKSVYYGLGWLVRRVDGEGNINRWHTGGFDGSSTILVIRHDGLCWAVLLNTSRTSDGQVPAPKIDGLVHGAADAVRRWPEHDLFSE
jgi:N-acyl-D-amino-acid deacylase